MKTKVLNNQEHMPALGLGTWLSKPGEVYEIVKAAIEMGYRHIDCAAIYGNEAEVGKALKDVLKAKIVRRDELFITSKLWNNAHAPEDVLPALKKTLTDLQLDYLDLYLIHWPVATKNTVLVAQTPDDYLSLEKMPIANTYRAMEEAAKAGLIKSLGVSNFSLKKLQALYNEARIKPSVNQVELHPYLPQQKLLNYCADTGIVLTAYSPLGSSGRPAGMQADNEPSLLQNEVVLQVAAELRQSPAQILISWALTRGTAVIPKTIKPSRAAENLKAQNIELTEQAMSQLAQLDRHFRYVNGTFFTPKGSPYTLENLWDE